MVDSQMHSLPVSSTKKDIINYKSFEKSEFKFVHRIVAVRQGNARLPNSPLPPPISWTVYKHEIIEVI